MMTKRLKDGGDDLDLSLSLATTTTTDCMTRRTSSHNDDNDHNKDPHHLPEWLLLEILIRLPLTSIFMLRCVSKCWNSLISVPFFTQRYLSLRINPSSVSSSRPSSSYTSWTLLHRDSEDHFPDIIPPYYVKLNSLCCSHDDIENTLPLTLSFSLLDLPPSVRQKHHLGIPDKYTVLASSNGLLLHSSSLSSLYYVCNPLTKQCIVLPRDYDFSRPVVGEGFVTQVDWEGMVTSFKVVQLRYSNYNSVCILQMEIFASETGLWSTFIVNCPQTIEIKTDKRPVTLNGVLHWFSLLREIVAYDPYHNTDRCRLIQLPRTRRLIQHTDSSLGCDTDLCEVSEGRLQYFEIDANIALVKLWVLEDYDLGIWYLEHRIRVYDMLCDIKHLVFTRTFDHTYPLAFHPFDSAIVYLCCRKRDTSIFSYNIRSNRLELLYGDFVSTKEVLSPYTVVPMVLPLWPPRIPQPSWEDIDLSLNL